ncbi:MAG TPA: nuclear transport factor 2 family protein [Allosphingosinicella sp.]|nr:nuclear transport factor 2 family protein [Allosphingosinicella sp.]
MANRKRRPSVRRAMIALSAVALAGCGGASEPEPAAAAAGPSAEEKAAVLQPVNAFLDGAARRDPAALRATIHPGGVAAGVGCGPTGQYNQLFAQPLATYVETVGSMPADQRERVFDPEVRIERNLATVWNRYEYSSGGRVRAAGYSSYQLVRVEGRWKIFNYSWSTRPQDCTPQ